MKPEVLGPGGGRPARNETPPARLLVVDDERLLLLALCSNLRAQGFLVTGVESGKAALDILGDTQFDVLLTDLMMAEMDGITLIRTALKNDPNLVAVLMTGHGTISSAVEALQAGAIDYVLKPFQTSTLRVVLDRALTMRRLRQKNAELEKRMHGHSAELESANKELEAFSYSVSHDLRGPVRALHGLSTVLLEDYATVLPAEGRRLVERIVANSHRMEELIAALLRLSLHGRQPLLKQAVDLSLLVPEVIAEVRRDTGQPNVEVKVAALPVVAGDAALLRQVFVNLLVNAFKFTRDRADPTIEIAAASEDGLPVISVHDNGVGFPQSEAERLFVPFVRLHCATDFEGCGVGLSIVQRIIERHGGRVWAEGEPGKGAVFHFSLPASA